MPEQWNVYLNSAVGTPNMIVGEGNTVSFIVNWDSILPKKYQRFLCSFIFRTEVSNNSGSTNLPYAAIISAQIGNTNNWDGMNPTNIIGVASPIQISGTVSGVASGTTNYWSCGINDNAPFTINYPTNNLVTISINNIIPTANYLTLFPQYILGLNFTAIDNEEFATYNEPNLSNMYNH